MPRTEKNTHTQSAILSLNNSVSLNVIYLQLVKMLKKLSIYLSIVFFSNGSADVRRFEFISEVSIDFYKLHPCEKKLVQEGD